MRTALILMVLCFGVLHAQQAALTAGSESLTSHNSEEQSITASQTVITQTGNYTKAPDAEEAKLVADKNKMPIAKPSEPNTFLYIIVFILIGVSFYFINVKIKKNMAQNMIKLESEEKDELKKEMWSKLSEENDVEGSDKQAPFL